MSQLSKKWGSTVFLVSKMEGYEQVIRIYSGDIDDIDGVKGDLIARTQLDGNWKPFEKDFKRNDRDLGKYSAGRPGYTTLPDYIVWGEGKYTRIASRAWSPDVTEEELKAYNDARIKRLEADRSAPDFETDWDD
jgi:hypothetical protein